MRAIGKFWRNAAIGAAVVALGATGLTPTASASPPASPVTFKAWSGPSLLLGQFDGLAMTAAQGRPALGLRPGATMGTWTSPVYESPAPIGDLVASWQANTPVGSWIEMHLSVRVGGHWSQQYVMGKWAFENAPGFTRTSVNGQADADGKIYTDTYVPQASGKPTAYRLQVVLHGTAEAKPVVYQLAATTSDLSGAPATSATTMSRTVDLPVPQFSQEIHVGEYPVYDGGGEAWCSPTATAMVLEYLHRGPSATDLAALPADPVFDAHGRTNAEVDYAALHTWDTAYAGTGNWPFNTAYASSYGLDGSVRQYTTLRDIEQWVKRAVPPVISIAWDNTDGDTDNDLANAPIASSGGHLMVVRGFMANGDVIAGDPAAPDNASVRRVYQRAQFERDWLNASTGTAYVIKPLWVVG